MNCVMLCPCMAAHPSPIALHCNFLSLHGCCAALQCLVLLSVGQYCLSRACMRAKQEFEV